mmetsp:Transcript_27758/g.60854  ORF Transcript_27758/g.60854 Transcript_27758/m.60854 type:complete len:180 (+) Transcript_27758:1694-2233(+)
MLSSSTSSKYNADNSSAVGTGAADPVAMVPAAVPDGVASGGSNTEVAGGLFGGATGNGIEPKDTAGPEGLADIDDDDDDDAAAAPLPVTAASEAWEDKDILTNAADMPLTSASASYISCMVSVASSAFSSCWVKGAGTAASSSSSSARLSSSMDGESKARGECACGKGLPFCCKPAAAL